MNADTILLELVKSMQQMFQSCSGPKTIADYARAQKALDAGIAWADAQKAPQPRTTPEQPEPALRRLADRV
jgi:hypothetical protein